MKKLLALLLAMVMVMGLAACGQKSETTPPADDQQQGDAQTPETPEEPAAGGEITRGPTPSATGARKTR